MANIIPNQLTSAEGLFRDRALLMPDKVKGVDPAKLSNVKGLVQNRKDIAALPWGGVYVEATDVSDLASDSGITNAPVLNAPKATTAAAAFKNVPSLPSFPVLTLTRCRDISELFMGTVIMNPSPPLEVGTVRASSAFDGATFGNDSPGPLFAAGHKLTNIMRLFENCNIKEIRGLNASTAAMNYSFVDPNKVEKFIDCDISGVEPFRTNWTVNYPQLTELDIAYYGILATRFGSGLTSWWGREDYKGSGSGNLPNVKAVATDIYDNVTVLADLHTASSLRGASLPQPMVDAVIKSLHTCLVTNGVTVTGTQGISKTYYLDRGNNAAPSAAVLATEVAALTGAGFTIIHN